MTFSFSKLSQVIRPQHSAAPLPTSQHILLISEDSQATWLGNFLVFIFLGPKITADGDCSHEIKRHLLLGRKAMTNLDHILKSRDIKKKLIKKKIKSRDITLPTKVCIVKDIVFYSSHVWMWELDHKGGWGLKNWYFWNMVLEKTLESPLGCKETKPVNPKGNQSQIFIARTDAEAEALILWIGLLTQCTWIWANSRRWWRTGKPGVLLSMGSQRTGHVLVTELNWAQ